MTQITANLDDRLLKEFRGVIYTRFGLRAILKGRLRKQ